MPIITGEGFSGKSAIAALLIARLLLVGAIVVIADNSPGSLIGVDTGRYWSIATSEGDHYRDFPVEYPPVAVAQIEATKGGSVQELGRNLSVLSFVFDVVTAIALAVGWGRLAAVIYLWLGLMVAPIVYPMIEPSVIAFAVLGLLAVKKGKDVLGGGLLALASFVKVWPVVVIPLLWQRGKRAAALAMAGFGAVGLAVWIAYWGSDAPIQVLTFRGAEGWEISSMVGSLLRLLTELPTAMSEGAYRLGDVSAAARAALLAATLITVLVAGHLGRGGPEGPVLVTCVAALLTFSPLGSPQFGLWLLPFVAMCSHRAILWAGAVVAFLTTILLYVWSTIEVDPGAPLDLLALAKNLAILALGVISFRVLLTDRRLTQPEPVSSVP
jgi:hypothetical protein